MGTIILLLTAFFASHYTGVFSLKDASLSNCMRLTTFNYHYTPNYRLESLDSDKNSTGFTFKFSVRAQSDAHLKLSSTPDPKLSPVTIEIVLGAGANSFSAVRRKPKNTATDLTNNTPLLLSKDEHRNFILVLKNDLLAVYANDTNTFPILVYADSSVIDMMYVAFGAWNNIAVEWSFDCKDAEVPEAPSADPVLRLKQNYWAHYDNFNPPILNNSTLIINVSIALIHINLNAKDGVFTMRGKFNVEWTDQKLQWDPEDYGNIKHLNFKHRVIWMPEFELLDVPKSDSSILEDRSVRLNYDGRAEWTSMGDVETWCDVDVTNWPADQHVCEVHIGLRSHPDTIQLKLKQSPDLSTLGTSGLEWNVISVTADEDILINTNETSDQSFKLRITLQRIQTSFRLVFFIPLFVSFSILMSNYVIPPQHKCRLALVSASIVVLYLLLILEDIMLPALPLGTPRIIKITCCFLLMAIAQLIFHSFNIHLVNLTSPAPAIVKNLAKKPWMKYLHQGAHDAFFPNADNEFHQFEQDDGSRSEADVKTVDMNQFHWALVSRALDMLTFFVSFFILPFLMSPF